MTGAAGLPPALSLSKFGNLAQLRQRRVRTPSAYRCIAAKPNEVLAKNAAGLAIIAEPTRMNDSIRGAIQQFHRAMPGLRALRELPESDSSICRWTLGFVNDRGNPLTDVSIGMDWREFDAFNFDF